MLSYRSLPPGDVIPLLAYPDVAQASRWLCAAFGFALRLRIADHRIQLLVGSGSVVLVHGNGADHAVMVRIDNADAHCGRAETAGASITNPPTTHPHGERQYSAEDFAGHRWTFTQTVADVHPGDSGGTLVVDQQR